MMAHETLGFVIKYFPANSHSKSIVGKHIFIHRNLYYPKKQLTVANQLFYFDNKFGRIICTALKTQKNV
jgi:hypothetical protein